MARYELVKGLPVMTMAEGKQVGKVDDLIVDPERKAVSWFRLHSGGVGMLGATRLWVPAEAVHGVGEHAVTINSVADARSAGDAPEAFTSGKPKRGIIGGKVMTENGQRLGEVRDYEFDPYTFALTSLSVPPAENVPGETLTIAGENVLTIGEDVIVVATAGVMQTAAGMADIVNQPIT
jgi:sporulation protein YlmC with PRC-barrel domain